MKKWARSLYAAMVMLGVARCLMLSRPFFTVLCGLVLPPILSAFFTKSLLAWCIWGILLLFWGFAELIRWGSISENAIHFRNHVKETAGLLWALATTIRNRKSKKNNPTEFKATVEKRQSQLLAHLLRLVEKETHTPKESLHACWMTYDADSSTLTTVTRDRPVEDRPKTRVLQTETHEVGAAYAIKNAQIFIENDTSASKAQALYGEELPYKSFISVPILIEQEPLGVLNVDSEQHSTFSNNLEWHIKEIGYIIAIGEVLIREDRNRDSNQKC